MRYAKQLEADLTKLKAQPLIPYKEAAKKFGDDQGVYVIWASRELVEALQGKKLAIHAAKKLQGQVKLDIGPAFKQASIGPNKERCYYIGKTTDFKKRHEIRRHGKLEEILDPSWSQKKIKEQLQYSFIPIEDWKLRFFFECYAIAKFLPVLNTQPER